MAEKTLTLRVASTGDAHLVEMLAPVIEADPTAEAGPVIAAGQLIAVQSEGRDVLALLLRRDGDELVIVAAAGQLPGCNLLDTVLPAIEAMTPARWVRIHSARRGMGRQLRRHGYQPAEVVYRKDLKNGR